jgi:GAF domain-containing protein
MAESLFVTAGAPREVIYEEVFPQLKSLLSDEPDLIANLANTAAVLREAFGFFWVGFYLMKNNELVLGPFQGPLACTRIAMGKGVCGTAALQQKTQWVPDVEQFPGHIACSSLSKSEIVVPLVSQGQTQLVLDVDSDKLDDFSEADIHHLERIIQLIHDLHFN